MPAKHRILRSFKLNKSALDDFATEQEDLKKLKQRTTRVIVDLQEIISERGYTLLCGKDLYRGLPERLLVTSDDAPFLFDRRYEKRVDEMLINIARTLNLPYEPETSFLDFSYIEIKKLSCRRR